MACFRNMLLATTALMSLGIIAAAANPLGSQVVGGAATVQGQGTASVTVNQSTPSAIINWQTFNIGAGQTTQFVQPNSSSVTLNRVTGSLGASFLDGTLTANGRVFLVNPDGVLFGANSKINTGSFLATTNDIHNDDFMAGRYQFNIPGRPDASIVNLGTITAQSGGFAALVAPGVRNTGTITANLGTIGLAAGNAFSLDFYGDKLITLGVNDAISAKVIDVATGQPLNALVQNDGKLKANGGRVELTAAAARQVVDAVINNTGVIEANSIGTKNGMIVLSAATEVSKPVGAPTQTVKISGKLSAAGKRKNSTGGTVVVTGEKIVVTNAKINASGQAGGGKVLIGGDVGGGKGNPAVATIPMAALESFVVPTALNVSVDATSTITASAKYSGNGGKVVVWADQATTFYGTIKAQGGSQSGNGGFVETSGHQTLTFDGTVNTSAPHGTNGTLLLDPLNATIDVNPGNEVITTSSIQTALSNGNVVVSTNVAGAEPGNITVAAPITWSSSSILSLFANNNIAINAAITGLNGGLTLNAAGSISVPAAVAVGIFNLQSGNWSQVSTSLPQFFANDFSLSGGSFLRVLSGDGSAGAPYKIADIYGLQGMGSSSVVNVNNSLQNVLAFSGNFVLANDIDASGTKNWRGSVGFEPIGQFSNSGFLGSLDGAGHAINQLTSPFGLFGLIGLTGSVSNLGLTNVSITSVYSSEFPIVGGLASVNWGTIFRTYVTGSVSSPNDSIVIGGLVGTNGNSTDPASISQSFSTAAVYKGPSALPGSAGGLVGQNSYLSTITNSYSAGTVTVTGQTSSISVGVGGLVGMNVGNISSSYSTGLISSGSKTTVGGLVGLTTLGSVNNSYWDAQSTGQQNSAGGTGSPTNQLAAGLPAGFDSSIWGITPNVTYPYFLWQPASTRLVANIASTPVPTPIPPTPALAPPIPTAPTLPVSTPAYPTGQTVYFTPAPIEPVVPPQIITTSYVSLNYPTNVSSQTPAPVSPYTFQVDSNGNVVTFENGVRISTGTAQNAEEQYGYNPSANTASTTSVAVATTTSGSNQSSASPSSPYTFQLDSYGNVIVFKNGVRLWTGTAQDAEQQYGYVPPASTSPQQTNTISPSQPTTRIVTAPPQVTPISWPSTTTLNTFAWTQAALLKSPNAVLNEMQPLIGLIDNLWNNVPPLHDWVYYARQAGFSQDYINAVAASGFGAGVYLSNGQPVLVFQSTRPTSINDWATDFLNAVGANSGGTSSLIQYSFAAQLAAQVAKNYPFQNVTLTGFSLGGGLAAYAGATDKMQAVTFSPAGISNSASYDPRYVLNFQMNSDVAQTGGSVIGTTVVFNQALTDAAAGGHSYQPALLGAIERHESGVASFSNLESNSNLSVTNEITTPNGGIQLTVGQP